MTFTNVSTSFLGKQPDCSACGAGGLTSLNWEYAKSQPGSARKLSVYRRQQRLRYGTLYRCQVCGSTWYMAGTPPFMNNVPKERLELLWHWNEAPIALTDQQMAVLEMIGRTPPDLYGNGKEFHETPCSVVTTSGEMIALAVVSMQRHAPFEAWRQCRLASDIAEIRPSPFAIRDQARHGAGRGSAHGTLSHSD